MTTRLIRVDNKTFDMIQEGKKVLIAFNPSLEGQFISNNHVIRQAFRVYNDV